MSLNKILSDLDEIDDWVCDIYSINKKYGRVHDGAINKIRVAKDQLKSGFSETSLEKSTRLEQFLLMLADRHVLEKKTKSVPVFDEFDTPWQTEYVCRECGSSYSVYDTNKECDRLREIKDFLGDTVDEL